MPRRVLISKRVPSPLPGKPLNWVWKDVGIATFCDFAIDHAEYPTGVGNYPCAVVEWPDGTVEVVPIGGSFSIKFLSEDSL